MVPSSSRHQKPPTELLAKGVKEMPKTKQAVANALAFLESLRTSCLGMERCYESYR